LLLTTLMFIFIPQHQKFLLDMAINEDKWIERTFLETDVGTMALSLYGQYGWPIILVGFLLLEAMLIAIDIAHFQYDKKNGNADLWWQYRLWQTWKARRRS
jgi:NADH:ubiquinone oxidoreductase subunit 6 (subunit J)